MRRLLIQHVLPFLLCLVPPLAAILVAVVIPRDAMTFFIGDASATPPLPPHISEMDILILALGVCLFMSQMFLCWRSLQWRGSSFNEEPDRWVNNLAQAAEWFPMLGLLGTVGGILQTFSSVKGRIEPHEIIRNYAPAITATGCGLYMAFINMLPAWIVIMGREAISTLGRRRAPAAGSTEITRDAP